jgi:hypothetical protein
MTVLDGNWWRTIEPLLDEAFDLPPAARVTWLESLRARAPLIAAEVSALLSADDVADREGFLSHPVEITLAGLEIGAYTLERPLGHGGMGSVWLARRTDGRIDGMAAVKLLNFALSGTWGRERFRREGSMLARVAHPGIARLLDAGVSVGGQPYLVLEYVQGAPIDQYAIERQLSSEARVRLLLQVLDAVEHAHANLVVHGDLKPSNILVTADGVAKLLDFGIAKLLDGALDAACLDVTMEGGCAFTPAFAAPEQATGGAITTATDVYACGVLLYLLLGGRHPTAEGCHLHVDVLRALAEVEPTPIGPDDIDRILRKALRKAPGERYVTVAALAEDLQRWLQREAVGVRPASIGDRLRLLLRQHLAATTGVVAVLLISIGWATTIPVDRGHSRSGIELQGMTPGSRVDEQGSMQEEPGLAPVALHGSVGNASEPGDLHEREAAEEVQVDEVGERRLERRELVERARQRLECVRWVNERRVRRFVSSYVERDHEDPATTLRGAPLARPVDDNSAHGARGVSHETGAIREVYAVAASHVEIGLVQERRRG